MHSTLKIVATCVKDLMKGTLRDFSTSSVVKHFFLLLLLKISFI